VIFEGADGSFGSIAPVKMRRSELKVDVVGGHEGL
jgi:hypothetical protein